MRGPTFSVPARRSLALGALLNGELPLWVDLPVELVKKRTDRGRCACRAVLRLGLSVATFRSSTDVDVHNSGDFSMCR